MPSLTTNSEVTLSIEVRNTEGELVDPDSIELDWWLGRWGSKTNVPEASLTHSSTGMFSATITPEDPSDSGYSGGVIRGGPIYLHYEFTMINPTYVERGKVALATSEYCG